jgi:hypothetical protein
MIYKFENTDFYLETMELKHNSSCEQLQIKLNSEGTDKVILLNKEDVSQLIGALNCIQKQMK